VRGADGEVPLEREGHHHEDGGTHGHVGGHVHVRQHHLGIWKGNSSVLRDFVDSNNRRTKCRRPSTDGT
jgi:hypothetical protein